MASTWETLEEREQRVRGTRTTTAMARAAEQIPEGKTLTAAFAERPFINREDLKTIARQHYERPVVTFYLNFSPERLVRADPPVFVSVFHSLRHQALEARKAHIEILPRDQRLGLPEDLRDVEAFLEGYQPSGARSIVVFKSGDQLNRVMPLPVRVADSLTIDVDPYVEPLEAIMEEQHRVLVVDLAKEKTTFFLYELGFEEQVHSIRSFVPSDAVDAGRPGKVQRHRLTHLQWHFKASAQAAERLFRERGCDFLALIGEETLVKEFEDYLAKSLRDRLVAELRWSPDDGPNRRRAALEGALLKQRKKEEEAALEELGFFQGHDRLAAGLEKVLDAANLFLMRRLVLDNELVRPGYVCRDHHFLSLNPGSCPFDGQALLIVENVVDELVEIARLHGVEVMLVEQRRDLLARYEGVAAVLLTAAPREELATVAVTS
jgi:Bacterial archaeo-eukaryotic release factor family 10